VDSDAKLRINGPHLPARAEAAWDVELNSAPEHRSRQERILFQQTIQDASFVPQSGSDLFGLDGKASIFLAHGRTRIIRPQNGRIHAAIAKS
jgi:hypothetical protein